MIEQFLLEGLGKSWDVIPVMDFMTIIGNMNCPKQRLSQIIEKVSRNLETSQGGSLWKPAENKSSHGQRLRFAFVYFEPWSSLKSSFLSTLLINVLNARAQNAVVFKIPLVRLSSTSMLVFGKIISFIGSYWWYRHVWNSESLSLTKWVLFFQSTIAKIWFL